MWTIQNEKLKAAVIGRSEIRVLGRKKLGFVEERNLGARKNLGITIEQIRVRGRSENQSINILGFAVSFGAAKVHRYVHSGTKSKVSFLVFLWIECRVLLI